MRRPVCFTRQISPVTCMIFAAAFICLLSGERQLCLAATQASYYVSPSGSDTNPGTEQSPFKTITKARDVIRSLGGSMTGDIFVYLREGTHFISDPIQFTPSDGGKNGHNVIYSAYANEHPIISGGMTVSSSWSIHQSGIYKTTLTRETKLRNLYINGFRAQMAEKSDVNAKDTTGTFTITGTEPWSIGGASKAFDALNFSPQDVGVYANPGDVELEWRWQWTANIVCARDIVSEGGFTVVKLQQPFGAIAAKAFQGWLGLDNIFGLDNRVEAPYDYFIRNAFELLDTPGEFYYNRQTKVLYYYSNGEDMATASVVMPVSQGLLRVYGTSTSNRVKNLQFIGLTFMYDDYLLEEVGGSRGNYGSQSSAYFYKFRAPVGNHNTCYYENEDLSQAAIDLRNCESIKIEKCRFFNLQSPIAVCLNNDVINSIVIGNIFKNTAGCAVTVAHPQHYKIGDGPKYPDGVEGACSRNVISNNWIRSISQELLRMEAIIGYHVSDLDVLHNDIENIPYGGISVGWWWGKTGTIPAPTWVKNVRINYNRVGKDHLVMHDGSGIYVMSPTPNSEIVGNYVFDNYQSLMPDEGAAYFTMKNNVCEKCTRYYINIWSNTCHDLILDNNYLNGEKWRNAAPNSPVTNMHIETSAPPWSSGAQAIIDAAGLEAAYTSILADTLIPTEIGATAALPRNLTAAREFTIRFLGHPIILPGRFYGKTLRIDILDLNGRLLQQAVMDKHHAFIGPAPKLLSTGLYVIRVKAQNGTVARKFMQVR